MKKQVGAGFHHLNRGSTLPEITMPASMQAAAASSHPPDSEFTGPLTGARFHVVTNACARRALACRMRIAPARGSSWNCAVRLWIPLLLAAATAFAEDPLSEDIEAVFAPVEPASGPPGLAHSRKCFMP